MPLRRDADGNVIDERTRLIRKSGTDPGGDDETIVSHTRRTAAIPRPSAARDGIPTVPVAGLRDVGRSSVPTKPVQGREVDPDDRGTRIYRPGLSDARAGEDIGSAGRRTPVADDPMVDPPVGWLVVIEGPGKGRVVTLGMGVNSIGRARTERVSLDYGDATISRTHHGAITYDPRGRKFYVQPGGGTNLAYANDEPVLVPRELRPSTRLQMGNTVLRFVPLCGDDFSWDDDTERD